MSIEDFFLFVSHVSEDRSAAMQVIDELERRGVRCWIAPRDLRPGRPFDDEIADAIEGARAMLLIFSERCNDNEYIRREITVAGESQKVVIPFRIENAQPKRGLRVRLSDLHWIDAFKSHELAIDEVIRSIGSKGSVTGMSKPTPLAQVPAATGPTLEQEIRKFGPVRSEIASKAATEKLRVLRTQDAAEKRKAKEHQSVSFLGMPPGTGRNVLAGLLIVQGISRAMLNMSLWYVQGFEEKLFSWTVVSLLLAAATITAGSAVYRNWDWARSLGITLCGIAALYDSFIAIAGLAARPSPGRELLLYFLATASALYLIVFAVAVVYLWRYYRPERVGHV
jgi:hypothetical protein